MFLKLILPYHQANYFWSTNFVDFSSLPFNSIALTIALATSETNIGWNLAMDPQIGMIGKKLNFAKNLRTVFCSQQILGLIITVFLNCLKL